ncbi:hypothetical protein [Nocardia carnea]|uniref:hypothetical protein n=1 Tax=Nocardia carnea TaxID=37328 RepID=UPI0024563534|nr:hypothetical protein [Nocardia carnea]
MTSPRPHEPDLHLSIHLHDYAACHTAAHHFLHEWRTHHRPDAATVVPGPPTGLSRLPNEHLYLHR